MATGAITIEREGEVALIVLDLPGESVNKFSRAVKDEFAAAIRALRDDNSVRAIVFISGKADNFVAGADIEEFVAARTEGEFRRLSREGQQFIDELERSAKPVVVAINGACLGGGLEISLGCHYRIASTNPRTVLGLPEVQLGIIPGAGGCNRLPRLVGLRSALDMILSSRNVKAERALKLGLVDEVVPAAILRQTALAAARRLAREGLPRRRPAGRWLLERTALGQALVLSQARKLTFAKTGGHYPAPAAALDAVRYSLAEGMEKGLPYEADRFAQMAMTEVSRRLVEIFFATTALKKDPGVAEPVPAPRPVNRVAILGSGFMGSGIATVAVDVAGVSVRMRDSELPRVGKGIRAVSDVVTERARRRSITRLEARRKLELLSGGVDWAGFGSADLVIEAVFEDLEVKRGVLREFERVARADAIFATNTSTIPIFRIAAASARPEQVIGMHFFSPVHRMPLLEVIAAERTSKETIVTAAAFGRRLGKTVIVVKDRPGFFINRILGPYMSEAGALLREGVPVEAVDRAMTEWGFPVGPITLLDEVGLDVAVQAAGVLGEAFGGRMSPAIPLDALVRAGYQGRKNGRGFFRYDKGKKAGVDAAVYSLLGITPGPGDGGPHLAERLSLAMLNEAARALEEGVIRSPRDGDIGAIFGIGFPPFRGGPFRVLDTIGASAVLASLERLAASHGPRFEPAEVIREQARSGGRFHAGAKP
jgi:3-hydroxyacyl-CoA dehydrogenase/enoyl-CoA hydratase/3-hydroxybutyryl-CoA epimerase